MGGLTILNNLFGIIGGIITIGSLVGKRLAMRRKRVQNQAGVMFSGQPPRSYQEVPGKRRYITHPVIFTIGIGTVLVQYFLQAAHITNNPSLGTLAGICFVAQIVCWFAVLRSLFKWRRVGWFIGMLIATIYCPIIYGLWGPTQQS